MLHALVARRGHHIPFVMIGNESWLIHHEQPYPSPPGLVIVGRAGSRISQPSMQPADVCNGIALNLLSPPPHQQVIRRREEHGQSRAGFLRVY